MPTVQANGIDIYYEVQGEGEPLVLIPYLAADQACYAFQVAEYAKHFTCFTVDLRVVVEGWQIMAQALGSVTDMVIKGIFPWCFTPELYAARPDYVDSLAEF